MKLKLLIFAMAVAAMGPARDAPPPELRPQPTSPEERAAPPQPEPARPGLAILGAADTSPADFLWKSRLVVVFADTPDDPAFRQQMGALEGRNEALIDRDVVVVVDSDPSANSEWRQQLHPRGFSMVIIDKDGQVKQRRPLPWDVREISRAIDKLPLRRQEIGRAGLLP